MLGPTLWHDGLALQRAGLAKAGFVEATLER